VRMLEDITLPKFSAALRDCPSDDSEVSPVACLASAVSALPAGSAYVVQRQRSGIRGKASDTWSGYAGSYPPDQLPLPFLNARARAEWLTCCATCSEYW
jgi:hypothetical protein